MNAAPFNSLISYVILIGLATLGRVTMRTWLVPSALLGIYWSAFIGLTLVTLPNDMVGPEALWVITGSVFAALHGAIVARRSASCRRQPVRLPPGSFVRWAARLAGVCSGLGLLQVGLVLAEEGYSPKALLSMSSLSAMAHRFSVMRYTGSYSPGFLAQFLLTFVYAAPAFGALVVALAGKPRARWLWGLLLPFLPSLLLMFIRTQRGAFITSVIFWLSVYLAARLMAGERHLFTKARVALASAFPIVFLSFAFVAVLRAGKTDLSMLPDMLTKVTTGAFGGPVNLSTWLHETRGAIPSPALGGYTFSGLYDALGWHNRVLGLFQEYHMLESGYTTNIYTLYRPLIEDWTLVGFLLVSVLFGFVSTRSFDAVRGGHLGALPLLSMAYATVLYSFNTSAWVWNSTIAAFLIFAAFCILGSLAWPRSSAYSSEVLLRGQGQQLGPEPLSLDG